MYTFGFNAVEVLPVSCGRLEPACSMVQVWSYVLLVAFEMSVVIFSIHRRQMQLPFITFELAGKI